MGKRKRSKHLKVKPESKPKLAAGTFNNDSDSATGPAGLGRNGSTPAELHFKSDLAKTLVLTLMIIGVELVIYFSLNRS